MTQGPAWRKSDSIVIYSSTMKISLDRCVACGNCVAICPVGAIDIDPVINRATVDQDRCVECFTCYRGLSTEHLNPTLVRSIRTVFSWFRLRFDPEPDVCPTAAIEPQELAWPRIVRRAFSDPLVPHESTGIHGRGTEEVKTNDVTQRVGEGEVGFTIEFGRPTISASFRDISGVTEALAAAGIAFEANNPVTHLMDDPSTGKVREDILDERVLSAIVEVKTTMERVPEILRIVREAAETIETIISVGVSTCCDAEGGSALESVLHNEGVAFWRGKTNLGLGRAPQVEQVAE